MRVVVALGGNALLRRGEPITVDTQRANFARIDDTQALLDGSAGTQITTSERPLAQAGSATAAGG
jgi:carbamate kinase